MVPISPKLSAIGSKSNAGVLSFKNAFTPLSSKVVLPAPAQSALIFFKILENIQMDQYSWGDQAN